MGAILTLPGSAMLCAVLALLSSACGRSPSLPETVGTVASASPTASAPASPAPSTTQSPASTSPASGELLAFIRGGDVWLVDLAAGSRPRSLGVGAVRSFAWISPTELDVLREARPEHELVGLDGSVVSPPFPGGGGWSPDGSRYALIRNERLLVFDRGGTVIASLRVGPSADECPRSSDSPLRFGWPAFTQDGARVIVAVACPTEGGAYSFPATLYEVAVNGSLNLPIARFHTDLREVTAPGIAPQGVRIAQTWSGGLSLCPVLTTLWVEEPTTGAREVTPSAIGAIQREYPGRDLLGGITGYGWGPSGEALAVSYDVSFCDRESQPVPAAAGLSLISLTDQPERVLTRTATQSPAWSPSGRLVAYVGGDPLVSRTGRVEVMEVDTGAVTELGEGSQPAWQPAEDGAVIASEERSPP